MFGARLPVRAVLGRAGQLQRNVATERPWGMYNTSLPEQPTFASSPARMQSFANPNQDAPNLELVNQTLLNAKHVPKKHCPICAAKVILDYKDVAFLTKFLTADTGAIKPRTMTGVCAKQQRKLARTIKRARMAGYLPFTSTIPGIREVF